MTNVAIAALVIGTMACLTVAFLWLAPGQAHRRTRALVGLVPGLIGAVIVGMLSTDFVPDDIESAALPWTVVMVSVAMVILTIRALARD